MSRREIAQNAFIPVLGLLIALAVMFAVESLCRVFSPLDILQFTSKHPVAEGVYWLDRGYDNHTPPRALSKRKPAGAIRIVTLGGSSAWGLPYGPLGSSGRWLQLMLQESRPDFNFELINLGYPSHGITTVYDYAQQTLAYAPDYWFVYCGHNELLPTNQDIKIFAVNHPYLFKIARALKQHSAFYNLLEKALTRRTREDIIMTSFGPGVDPTLAKQIAVAHFQRTLDQLATLAQRHHVRLILATLPVNLSDWEPLGQPKDEDRANMLARRLRSQLDAGQPVEAASTLKRLQELFMSTEDPRILFWQGKLALIKGDCSKAKKLLNAANENDPWKIRAFESINKIISDTAHKREIPLAQIKKRIDQRTACGTPGFDSFLDGMHPRTETHFLMALEFYRVLRKSGAPGLPDIGHPSFKSYLIKNPGLDRAAVAETAGTYLGLKRYDLADRYFLEASGFQQNSDILLGRTMAKLGLGEAILASQFYREFLKVTGQSAPFGRSSVNDQVNWLLPDFDAMVKKL